MSSSPSLAKSPPAARTKTLSEPEEVLPFRYCEVAGPAGRRPAGAVPGGGLSSPQSLLWEAAEREGQVREAGRQQGEREARARFEEQLGRERAAVAEALRDFARQRADYYRKIEREAVQLALSIAHKVLHREAQVDPLLLMGVVRVALDQIDGATKITLAVPPQQAAEWRRFLAAQLEPGQAPEVVEDPALTADRCELRTAMGTAEMGLEVQLKEIEKGLMDLLAVRPQEKP